MPIRFKCPNCKRTLSVKEHLAGKKAACPACKKSLRIPKLPPPEAEVEELAASAFAEKPPAPKELSSKLIDFSCVFCGNELHLSEDLAGKQMPCPECARIIRVPVPKVDKPKDWRNLKQGASGALLTPEEMEATAKTKVSREALEEADALPIETVSIGVEGWVRRIFLIAAVLGVGSLTLIGLRHRNTEQRQKEAVHFALEFVEPRNQVRFNAWAAEVYRAAGEINAEKRLPDKAREFFIKARSQFVANDPKVQAAHTPDQEYFLIGLALSQVELGGSAEEVFDKERLAWEDVQKEIVRTLEGIQSSYGRVAAIRTVGAKLQARKQEALAIGIAGQLGTAADLPVHAQKVALLIYKDPDKARELMKPPEPEKGPVSSLAVLGYAEGWASRGEFTKAADLFKDKGQPEQRFPAYVASARAALSHAPKPDALEHARAMVGKALEASRELKTRPSPWLLVELAKAGARTPLAKETKDLIDQSLPDSPFKSLAHLEWLHVQLSNNTGKVPHSLIDSLIANKDSLAYALAWENLARHNARLGYRQEMLQVQPSIDRTLHPYLHLGAALGEMDRKK